MTSANVNPANSNPANSNSVTSNSTTTKNATAKTAAPDLSRFKALIFDMDGTLIDTMPSHLSAWQQTAEQYQFPYDADWIYSMGGMPTLKVAKQLNQRYQTDIDPEQVAHTKTQKFASLIHDGKLIDCTFELLKANQGMKKIAIGTGSNHENAIKLLEFHQLMPMLDALVTSKDVINHKPNPDTFLLAAEKLGVDPKDCVVFEDTDIGKQAALAAGMACIMVVGDDLILA